MRRGDILEVFQTTHLPAVLSPYLGTIHHRVILIFVRLRAAWNLYVDLSEDEAPPCIRKISLLFPVVYWKLSDLFLLPPGQAGILKQIYFVVEEPENSRLGSAISSFVMVLIILCAPFEHKMHIISALKESSTVH